MTDHTQPSTSMHEREPLGPHDAEDDCTLRHPTEGMIAGEAFWSDNGETYEVVLVPRLLLLDKRLGRHDVRTWLVLRGYWLAHQEPRNRDRREPFAEELADHLGVSVPTLRTSIASLERHGWLQREWHGGRKPASYEPLEHSESAYESIKGDGWPLSHLWEEASRD